MNYKFRASFSILDKWSRGYRLDALMMYFKLGTQITSPQAEYGREMHEEWRAYVEEHKHLPDIFGGKEVKNPVLEEKRVIQLDDWLEFVFIPDLIHDIKGGQHLIDYKTGRTPIDYHISTFQLPIYAYCANRLGFNIRKASIYQYDQYKKKTYKQSIEITEEILNKAFEFMVKNSYTMHQYLVNNNLYDRYSTQDSVH